MLTEFETNLITECNSYGRSLLRVGRPVDSGSQNSSDDEVRRIVSVKVIFEKNMDESYKDNPERRDSIFQLVEPCMYKEAQFRSQ